MTEQHPADASASALARAEELDAAVRRRSRWTVRYLVTTGLLAFAFLVSVTATELDRWFLWVPPAAIVVTIVALNFLPGWQPVTGRRFPRNQAVGAWGYMLLNATVVLIGFEWFEHDLAWWIPGAAATATPWFLAAYLEARGHRRTKSRKETQ